MASAFRPGICVETGMRAIRSAAGRAAFTLIELLLVIAIIGILLAMIVVVVGPANVNAKIAVARTDIQCLAGALAQYELERGSLPPSGNASLVAALSMPTKDGPGHYMEFKREQAPRIAGGLHFQDLFGNDYVYIRLPDVDARGKRFYIYSRGPNGRDDSDDNADGVLTETELSGDRGDDILSS